MQGGDNINKYKFIVSMLYKLAQVYYIMKGQQYSFAADVREATLQETVVKVVLEEGNLQCQVWCLIK